VRWAATSVSMSYRSPLAAARPCYGWPYHLAMPVSVYERSGVPEGGGRVGLEFRVVSAGGLGRVFRPGRGVPEGPGGGGGAEATRFL
jgi:hypothetical protein